MSDIYRRALAKFGQGSQIDMCIEEMSELTKELCKYKRGENNMVMIAEEIADVEITLEQMKLLYVCEELTAEFKEAKLRRLEERLKY